MALTLEDIKSLATSNARGGMLASVFAAQAILESGVLSGGSVLSNKYNNYFGIKAGSSWKGKTVSLPTKEVVNGQVVSVNANFRVYETPADSFADRAKLLLSLSRYKEAYTKTTPKEQAEALQKAGYATATSYASSIMSLVNRYNLQELDKKKMI
ncbi:MAG: glucosaminidase domain-containing protein [Bacteroidales bacterium]|nr:glucosaminidase domain-containing protein [Bacteroidales bacterium]